MSAQRACRECGCTQNNACVTDGVPCHWVEQDLCSACVKPSEGQTGRITRDADYPAEAAQLMAAFNVMADGHDTLHVVDAAANFLIAAIGGHARARGFSLESALWFAARFGSDLPGLVAEQWDREPSPTDVAVRHG